MVGQPHPVDSAGLDFEREASMADEGGVSGAVMESQEPDSMPVGGRDAAHRAETPRESRWRAASFLAGVAVGAALGVWAFRSRD